MHQGQAQFRHSHGLPVTFLHSAHSSYTHLCLVYPTAPACTNICIYHLLATIMPNITLWNECANNTGLNSFPSNPDITGTPGAYFAPPSGTDHTARRDWCMFRSLSRCLGSKLISTCRSGWRCMSRPSSAFSWRFVRVRGVTPQASRAELGFDTLHFPWSPHLDL
jgi:hypothetical protein